MDKSMPYGKPVQDKGPSIKVFFLVPHTSKGKTPSGLFWLKPLECIELGI
jgi:hypothetical protein